MDSTPTWTRYGNAVVMIKRDGVPDKHFALENSGTAHPPKEPSKPENDDSGAL